MAAKETIRIRKETPKGRFGEPGDPFPWRDIPGTVVVPRSSTEIEQRGEIIISGFMVKPPKGTVVLDSDEVEIRGRTQEIDGVVGDYGKGRILFYTKRVG